MVDIPPSASRILLGSVDIWGKQYPAEECQHNPARCASIIGANFFAHSLPDNYSELQVDSRFQCTGNAEN